MNRPLRRTGTCDSARGLPSDDAGLRFLLSCSLASSLYENCINDNMGLLSKIADKVTGHDDDDKKRPHGTTYGCVPCFTRRSTSLLALAHLDHAFPRSTCSANDSPYPGANAYGGPNAGFSSPPSGCAPLPSLLSTLGLTRAPPHTATTRPQRSTTLRTAPRAAQGA